IYMEAPTPGAIAPAGYSYLPDVATRKYADSLRANDTYYDGHSVDILRYADVLLSRAEALNEITPVSPEAITLINQVKGRSHAPLLDAANFNQSTLRDAILQERGWELYYEGKRRADLIRMDKYDVIENAHLVRIGLPASIVMPKNKYFPYPQNQVNINPNLNNADR
ncbi:MAG: RagB/SusD family nutrient uptake outer membrane protein, partial [Ferruginibacter sp.]